MLTYEYPEWLSDNQRLAYDALMGVGTGFWVLNLVIWGLT